MGDTKTFSAFGTGTFGFYDQAYKGLSFTDDGFLVYGSGYGASPWTPQAVPSAAKPNNVAALLWQDMDIRYDAQSGAGVTLASTAGANQVLDPGEIAIVEFDDMRVYGDAAGAGGSLDMQVIATAGSNDLVFVYDNITPGAVTGGDPEWPVTIGTENADGTGGRGARQRRRRLHPARGRPGGLRHLLGAGGRAARASPTRSPSTPSRRASRSWSTRSSTRTERPGRQARVGRATR